MKVRHIRNATIKIEYGGKIILVDPMLSKKGELPAFAPPMFPMPASGNTNNNPLVELPCSVEEILSDVDAIIITHTHLDHWDPAAVQAINKEIPIFVQNEEDASSVRQANFRNVFVLGQATSFSDITLTHISGKHASTDEMLEVAGKTCGVVFQHQSEPTVYLIGDSVWYDKVEDTLKFYQPEFVIMNAGNNQFEIGGPVVMGAEDVLKVHQTVPQSLLIAVHMEAINHAFLTRQELRLFSQKHGFAGQLYIPLDGEKMEF